MILKIRKSALHKRTEILHKAYTDYIDAIDNKGSQNKRVKESDLRRKMTELFVQMSDLSLTGEATNRKVLADIDRRIVCNDYRCGVKRDLIDRVLTLQLVGRHGLGKEQANELFDIFRARMLGWKPCSHEQSSCENEPPLPPYDKIDRVRGLIYSGTIGAMYREAVQLNANSFDKGSLWATSTCTPELIRDELISQGVDPKKIHIHTEATLAKKKLLLRQGWHRDYLIQVIDAALSATLEGVHLDRAMVTFCTLVRGLQNMGGKSKTYILSPEDVTLGNLVDIAENCDDYDRMEAARQSLKSMAMVLGVDSVDASSVRALQLWEDYFSEAKVLLRTMKNMFTNDECSRSIDCCEGVIKRNEHHIFYGEEVSLIGATLLKDFATSARVEEMYDGGYHLKSESCPTASCFIEQGKYLIAGFCVMPAAARGIGIANNVFFTNQSYSANYFSEEFASAYSNSVLKVVRHSSIQGSYVADKMFDLLLPELKSVDPMFFKPSASKYNFPPIPFVVC